jgi:hypothetical protein
MGKLIYPFEKAEYFIQPFLFYQENTNTESLHL